MTVDDVSRPFILHNLKVLLPQRKFYCFQTNEIKNRETGVKGSLFCVLYFCFSSFIGTSPVRLNILSHLELKCPVHPKLIRSTTFLPYHTPLDYHPSINRRDPLCDRTSVGTRTGEGSTHGSASGPYIL